MLNRGVIFLSICSMVSMLQAGGWELSWSDEFDSTALNESNWMVRVANARWVNNEEQRYTAGHDNPNSNIFVKDGYLILEGRKTSSGEIISGRIEGMNKKTFKFGRMEARARMPKSQGYWPAIWMLGATGGWPSCGEIDIMEGKGQSINWTSCAFHSSLGTPTVWSNYTMPDSVSKRVGNVHDSFHIYAVEWSADSIRWYFDQRKMMTLTTAAKPGVPINKEYYFILNVAVGGQFSGYTNSSTVYPESMVVDYVRVFKWNAAVGTHENNVVSDTRSTGYQVQTGPGGITVIIPDATEYALDVMDLRGRKILSTRGHDTSVNLSKTIIGAGTHVIRIQSRFGTYTTRTVIP